jgi:peptidoglycan hydrolase-like protein with peptidoglycan-binding domain
MKTISKIAAIALVAVAVVGVNTASAQTTAELMAAIAKLQAQIATLSGTPSTTPAPAAAVTFSTNLTVGSKGADVTALQNFLIGKGYNTLATGYFGPMTKAALAAYQTAKGITPAVGYFGPLTRAAVNGEAAVVVPPTTTPTTTTSGKLEGGAGSITVSTSSTDVEDTILEGATENVLGFKVEASDSDVAITNIKVTLENADGTSSPRLSRYADKVEVYMGSTKVGSVDVADFTKNGDVYSKSITLSNAIVREGSSKKATFAVKVTAISGIDSDDIDTNNWDLTVNNIRFEDATGAIITDTSSVTNDFAFTDLSTSGDVKLTVSKGSSSPVATNVIVSDTGSTADVLMLEFKMKATESDLSFDSLDVTLATSSGTSTLANILGELVLKNGSTELANESTFDADGAQTLTFDLDDTFTVKADTTETFRVYAKINDSDNFVSGDSVTVSTPADIVDAEDKNGDVVVETGTATGEAMTFVLDVPVLSLVGTPTLALYTHTDGTAAGEEDLYKATIAFKVTAPDSNDVYLPLDTAYYGLTGTSSIEYTKTGSATTTSAVLSYTGSHDIDETGGYRVSAGDSEDFAFTVYLTGNDAQGKITVTSVWYEETNTAPNGTPEVTSGLTTFKTPLVLLAK